MEFFGIQNACKLAFYNKTDGKLALYFPSANKFGLNLTGEVKEALANGSTAITWQANRKGTMALDTQLISPRLLTIILGAVETTEATGNITQFETGRIDSSTSTFSLANAPATGTLTVFLTEADGKTVKSELSVAAGASPTASEYKISGQVITVDASNQGKPILCIYAKAGTNITKLVIKSNVYASPYKVVALGTVRTEATDKLCEITLPSITFQSNTGFDFDSANPSSFSFTADLSADPVTNNMIEMRYL
jgi:hypothetical protein